MKSFKARIALVSVQFYDKIFNRLEQRYTRTRYAERLEISTCLYSRIRCDPRRRFYTSQRSHSSTWWEQGSYLILVNLPTEKARCYATRGHHHPSSHYDMPRGTNQRKAERAKQIPFQPWSNWKSKGSDKVERSVLQRKNTPLHPEPDSRKGHCDLFYLYAV